MIFKSPIFVPFGANLAHFLPKPDIFNIFSPQLHLEEAWPEIDDDEVNDVTSHKPNHVTGSNTHNSEKQVTSSPEGSPKVTVVKSCFRYHSDQERQENLRHKKELIRSHRAQKLTR